MKIKMYNIYKKLLKLIFPRKILNALEPFLRSAYYLFYIGNKYQCSVCNKKTRKFIEIKNSKFCPNCGSIARDRRLYTILNKNFLKEGIKILDFSPSRVVYRKIKTNQMLDYTSSDLSGNFIAEKKFDITNISMPDNFYDLIVCYHILEHIESDKKAMSELYRVLKKNGHCIIQTPFKEGDIYEDNSIKTKEDRTKYFGQEDHVRIYSVQGLKKRLEKSGFQVLVNHFTEKQNNKFGYSIDEYVLICQKV